MDALIDNVARILATGHSRREAFRLIGGAFAAAVVGAFAVEPLSAQGPVCTPEQTKYGAKPCGAVKGAQCCPADKCCAIGGQSETLQVTDCCDFGECYCANGLCAPSKGGNCPGGCTLCTAKL